MRRFQHNQGRACWQTETERKMNGVRGLTKERGCLHPPDRREQPHWELSSFLPVLSKTSRGQAAPFPKNASGARVRSSIRRREAFGVQRVVPIGVQKGQDHSGDLALVCVRDLSWRATGSHAASSLGRPLRDYEVVELDWGRVIWFCNSHDHSVTSCRVESEHQRILGIFPLGRIKSKQIT